MISNVLWIQTLLESDLERYVKSEQEDWIYLRFRTIAALDPYFYENYLYGGMYLSVIKDDLESAAEIFELGLLKYPDDYRLNYYAGFNYFYEIGDYQKGYDKLKRIENNPKAPLSLKFVINKLRFETTRNYEVTLAFLKETYRMTKSEMIREKLAGDIYSVVSRRDLECLNGKGINCNMIDAEGLPYFKNEKGIWTSRRHYKDYKIFRPEEKLIKSRPQKK